MTRMRSFCVKIHPIGVPILIFDYFCTQKGVNMEQISEYVNMEQISEYVKRCRKEQHLTQPELAHKAGVGLRFLRELEQGKQSLRMDKVNQASSL